MICRLVFVILSMIACHAGAIEFTCEQLLAEINQQITTNKMKLPSGQESVVDEFAVMTETHPLTSLFATNDEENLAVQKPFITMNAAQRLLALIASQGKTRINVPGSAHRKVFYFPLFSEGLDVVDGNRIVGQYLAVQSFVDNVRSQAMGDRSGNSPVLLTGPHGTGKSEFLKIIRSVFRNLTAERSSKYATYTFEFKDLHLIPNLRKYVSISTNPSGDEVSLPKEAPLNDSPLTILPPALQNEVIERTREVVMALTDGIPPLPSLEPDPHSRFYRDEIIKYYRLKLGRDLSNAEILAILNRHVVVKRVVFGRAPGTMPTIEYQGNDIDTRGLFMAPDMVNTMDEGPGRPLSWLLNGKMLLGNGNATMVDEVMRNSPEFLNLLLAIFESRVVDLGGSPRVPFNTVIVAATNKANVDVALKDKTMHATLDRFNQVNVPYSPRPHEVLETLLYMKKVGLAAIALHQEILKNPEEGEENSSTESTEVIGPVNMRELFPLPESGRPVQGPDGRYRLWYTQGQVKIDIAPHAMLFLAEIVAATRIKTSIAGFEEIVGPNKIVMQDVFRSEVSRINMHEGTHKITLAEMKDLEEATTKINEGDDGMSSRDAGRWLSAVLEKAAAPENKNTLTPDIVITQLKEMLDERKITAPSDIENARWLVLARKIAYGIVLPRIRRDIHRALAANDNNVEAAYDEVMEELKALDADPDAKTITTSLGRSKTINQSRLEKVKVLFRTIEGRELNPGKILVAVHVPNNGKPVNNIRHPVLLEAVTQYYADLESQKVSFDSLYETLSSGEGNEEKQQAAKAFIQGMMRLGYNEHGALMALETEKLWREELKQVK